MNNTGKDLFVLVADKDIMSAVEAIFSRPESLKIREISPEIMVHPQKDSGCRSDSVRFLREQLNKHDRALVIFDYHGCGSSQGRVETQKEMEKQFERNGWRGDKEAKVIVIDPEIEAWVWSSSPRVPEILGWKGGYKTLRGWLEDEGFWQRDGSNRTIPSWP